VDKIRLCTLSCNRETPKRELQSRVLSCLYCGCEPAQSFPIIWQENGKIFPFRAIFKRKLLHQGQITRKLHGLRVAKLDFCAQVARRDDRLWEQVTGHPNHLLGLQHFVPHPKYNQTRIQPESPDNYTNTHVTYVHALPCAHAHHKCITSASTTTSPTISPNNLTPPWNNCVFFFSKCNRNRP
jgi:hypothetical protein